MKRLDQSWTGWKEGQVLRLGREPGPLRFTFCMATLAENMDRRLQGAWNSGAARGAKLFQG